MHQLDSKYLARRPPPPPDPRGQKVKIQLFQNMVMLYNKLKGAWKTMQAHILSLHTPSTCGLD